jgi:dTMP kinase
MTDWMDNLAGTFLAIDGPDGAGKSTQLDRLRHALTERGLVVETVFDPGGTDIGQQIRHLLLHTDVKPSPMCETLLFMASRAQLVSEKVRPALDAGKVVLSDRFISATLAYQGALGVDARQIIALGEIAVSGVWPDLTLLLDLPVEEGLQRIGIVREPARKRQSAPLGQLTLFGDRLETRSTDYHQQVRSAFRSLDAVYPAPVRHVDAVGSEDEVAQRMMAAVEAQFTPRPAQREADA